MSRRSLLIARYRIPIHANLILMEYTRSSILRTMLDLIHRARDTCTDNGQTNANDRTHQQKRASCAWDNLTKVFCSLPKCQVLQTQKPLPGYCNSHALNRPGPSPIHHTTLDDTLLVGGLSSTCEGKPG